MREGLLFFIQLAFSFAAFAQSEPVPVLPTPATLAPGTAATPAPKPLDKKVSVEKPAPSSSTISITKVVGEVGDQIVTSREVKINSAVEQAIEGKPISTDEGFKILTGAERVFPSEVSRVLDEWSVFFEARSLGSSTASKPEVSRYLAKVQERWGTNQAWKDLDVGADELKTVVERKLAAAEFQKLKSDPALSPVSDDEALTYYKKNRLRFGSLPFSSFSENIKTYLVKSQVERRLSEWHEVLRRKYKSRNFISG